MPENKRPGLMVIGNSRKQGAPIITEPGNDHDIEYTKRQASGAQRACLTSIDRLQDDFGVI